MDNKDYQKFLLAKEHIKNGNISIGMNMLATLYLKNKNDKILSFEYARQLIKSKKNVEFGKDLLKNLLTTQSRTYAILELGKIEKEEGNLEKAREYFEQLLTTKSRTYAILELGKIEKENENVKKAREYFEQLLTSQNREYAILELGKIEKEDGNIKKAREYFEQLLTTQSRTYAILELGKIEKEEGNVEKAREYFESLLTSKNRAYAILELGKLERERGNIKKAQNYFEQLLTSQNRECAILELGKMEKEDGNVEKAREYFEQLVLTSNSEYAMLELGRLERETGNIKKASYFFSKLAKSPKNRAYAMLEMIFLNIKLENYNEAYKIICSSLNEFDNKNIKYNAEMLKNVIFYLKYKLGKLSQNDLNSSSYYCKQLLNYDELEAIKHIKSNLDEKDLKLRNVFFDQNIDVLEIFNNSKEKILEINPLGSSIYDKYMVTFDYPISNINGEEIYTAKIFTLINTKQIISIYPAMSNNLCNNIKCKKIYKI